MHAVEEFQIFLICEIEASLQRGNELNACTDGQHDHHAGEGEDGAHDEFGYAKITIVGDVV